MNSRYNKFYYLIQSLIFKITPATLIPVVQLSIRIVIREILFVLGYYLPRADEKSYAISITSYAKKYKNFPFLKNKLIKTVLRRVSLISQKKLIKINKLFTKKDLKERRKLLSQLKQFKYDLKNNYWQYKNFRFYYPAFDYIILNGGFNFLKRFRKKISQGVCIDGGAYWGETAIILNHLFRPKEIFCFEPDKDNFKKMRQNLSLYNFKNVKVYQLGLGEKNKKVNFNSSGICPKISDSDQPADQKIKIIKLDNFIKNRKISFVKLDLEDYELEALIGMKNIIKKDKPIIFCSLYHSGKNFFEVPLFIKKIRPDYKFQFFNDHPLFPFLETTLVAF